MPFTTTSDTRLLFIGDSITDVGQRTCPERIGNGYVRVIRDLLLAKSPVAPQVINRGISGNKVPDLQNRWQRDVLDEKPDILSIYIGINDVWHGFKDGRSGTTLDAYTAGYRDILSQTRKTLPNCGITLCEPSVIWLADPADANERLLPYVDAVHKLAKEFRIEHVVPLHGAFNAARANRSDIAWTTDGVHPTSAGHALIARTWLTTVGLW
jgi:lysophospholipase L1-like esterase